MAPMPTAVLVWKTRGNTHFKDGDYFKAIKCYNEALRQINTDEHAQVLLSNRCQARLSNEEYDAAVQDAIAVLAMAPTSEKALFRAARAYYCLGYFAESTSYLQQLIKLYPGNDSAIKDLERCKIRSREQSGDYDFASMLEEAIIKQPSSRLDRATYVGPVKVRECAIKAHGRGLFTTKAVKAGELLLCEKAFATAFAPNSSDSGAQIDQSRESQSGASDWRQKLGVEIITTVLVKLLRNPSVVPVFTGLYPGPEADEQIDENTGIPVIDNSVVENRINYNAFRFTRFTYEFHWKSGHCPGTLKDEESGSIGIWTRGSYVNHSCDPLVRRSYIGDMMIFRAQADIPADTEFKIGYGSCLEIYEERRKMLEKWNFQCECQLCLTQKGCSHQNSEKRVETLDKILEHLRKSNTADLKMYVPLLDTLESTYVNPPAVEPRLSLISPSISLISSCHSEGRGSSVIELSLRMLHALGFETEITETSFKMTRWGCMIDQVVVTLAAMCDGYAAVKPAVYGDALEVTKLAYEIMCGERVSWDKTYEGHRRVKFGCRAGKADRWMISAGRYKR